MRKFASLSVFLIMVMLFTMFAPVNLTATPLRTDTAVDLLPTGEDNLCVNSISTSELVATKNGFMRVFYDGSKVRVENYDDSFQIQSKKSLDMELNLWGGFFAGSDSYYLVEGQNNTAENDSAEVIRVIRYDTSWNRKGVAKITSNAKLFGGQVRYPFDVGCVEATEYNGKLYIVTGHEGYVDPQYNQGHQGFLMLEVDEATMTGKIVSSDLWHSFAQYIKNKDSNLYVLEQSEGSRYTKLSRYRAGDEDASASIPVLNYGGSRDSAWAIPCYASVDGMALSGKNVLSLGTSIDQKNYDNVTSDMAHNLYLTVTPMADFTESATKVKWLTNYTGEGKCFLGTKITKINDDRFLISWEEFNTSKAASSEDSLSGSVLHYLFVDGSGEKLTGEFTAAAPISDCQPIVKNSKVVYYASNGNMVNFYSINAQTGAFSKKSYRVAGENATWEYKSGTLTISGTGAITVVNSRYRFPVSSTQGGYSYYESDLSPWKALRDQVTKLVIKSGITSVSDNAFENFSKLAEVNIASGVKSIGKEAFAYNSELQKITIPASVTQIGEDILWTGYYWVSNDSHVVYATIYGVAGSYAQTYAQKNNITFEAEMGVPKLSSVENTATGVKISWGKVTGAAKYRVFYKTGSGGWTKIADTTSSSYTWKSAKSGTKYSFTVRCLSFDGKTYTSAYDTTGKSITYIAAPGKPTVTNVNGGLKVSWNKVAGAAKYRLFYKTTGGWTKLKDTTATSVTLTSGSIGKTYTYTVRCISSDGKKYTSSYDATGGKGVFYKLATPSKPTFANVNGGLKISWNKVAGAAKYRLFYKTTGGWTKLKDTTATSVTLTSGNIGKTYTYTVRCISSDGKKYTSAYNTTGSKGVFYKLATPAKSTVANVDGGLKISWGKVAGAAKYRVFCKTGSGGWTKIADTTSTSYTWKSAKSGTKYSFTVRCLSFDGKTYTSAYDTTGKSITYITAPGKPTVTNVNGGLKVSWNKVAGAAKYRVFYKTGSRGWTKITDTTSTSYTWKGAKKGTKYSFTIRCISSDGKTYTSTYDKTGTAITAQ